MLPPFTSPADESLAYESPESSSPIITRAVAAGLAQERFCTYPFPPLQRAALRGLGLLPPGAARFAISRFERLSGLDPARLSGFNIEQVIQERLKDYAALPGKFPCITVGAGLGGASAALSLAVGGPFLPQAFVTTLRGGAYDGDVQTYFRLGHALALDVARRNPSLLTIQHYDPVHDEWMTRFVNHLRFKLLDFPSGYAKFIQDRLLPGGAVLYLDSRASWLRYRVGPHSVFQVGGWGDLSPQEFLEGSPRLLAYTQKIGLQRSAWPLPGFPLESGPESEWGSEPGLGYALEQFCAQAGFRFVRLTLPHPHDFSRLAFRAFQSLIEQQGQQPAGVLIEMFSQFDPTAALQAGLLPLWLIFNTHDSLAFLESMRPYFPPSRPVFFAPLATFTPTPDLAPWQGWTGALQGTDWVNIGTRPSHYPADAWTLLDWQKPLHAFAQQHPQPIRARLAPETLLALAQTLPRSEPS